MDCRHSRPPMRSARGFTLIEIVVVLLIVSVLIAMAAAMTRGVVAAQQRTLTSTRMAGIDAALAQFVATQKRLPCPALGTRGPGDAALGTEENRTSGGCTSNQQNGIVPFRALGLVEIDALDGWGHRLTYRVDPQLASDVAMDMSNCDPAGNQPAVTSGGAYYICLTGCVAGNMSTCTSPAQFLTRNNPTADPTKWGKGLLVKSVAGAAVMNPNLAIVPPTGAAYVVISGGETGGGVFQPSGIIGASTATDGTEEVKNYATAPFNGQTITYYVDDTANSVSGATHFDDIMSHPSVFSVLTKAGLGPRAHN